MWRLCASVSLTQLLAVSKRLWTEFTCPSGLEGNKWPTLLSNCPSPHSWRSQRRADVQDGCCFLYVQIRTAAIWLLVFQTVHQGQGVPQSLNKREVTFDLSGQEPAIRSTSDVISLACFTDCAWGNFWFEKLKPAHFYISFQKKKKKSDLTAFFLMGCLRQLMII